MSDDWQQQWEGTWAMLCSYYPGERDDRHRYLYSQVLNDVPAGTLRAAALQCVGTLAEFPTVAELRGAAGLLVEAQIPAAVEAWSEVVDAVEEACRSGEPIRLRSELAAKVVKAIGPYRIATERSSDILRQRFCEAYNDLARRARLQAQITPQAAACVRSAPESLKVLVEVNDWRLVPPKGPMDEPVAYETKLERIRKNAVRQQKRRQARGW